MRAFELREVRRVIPERVPAVERKPVFHAKRADASRQPAVEGRLRQYVQRVRLREELRESRQHLRHIVASMAAWVSGVTCWWAQFRPTVTSATVVGLNVCSN